ncbi:MAG TPA: 4Fe-4S dicluster domain-containing protein [Sedimentisphaerales bacterium]|nr:4Fe-4S dicluster domain-containing protein [Sedimentisphaerales bacterium]
MKAVFIRELKPLLDTIAEQMELYVPRKSGEYYVFSKYDPATGAAVEFNNIRVCTPVKEFLFPLRELAAVFPEPAQPPQIKPFAVFGLKDCDLRSIEVLDKVFAEEEFEDPFYVKRRKNMFIIASDCSDPAESCICNVLDGKPYATSGFDLNVSKIRDGFVVETGSDKGEEFVEKHSQLFSEAPETLLGQRDEERVKTQKQLEQQNAELNFNRPVKEVVENSEESDVFDQEAKTCIECQACTRICPTCHCFYLYDTSQKDYFAKMKMWDSCMRMAYAEVAGGANPHKILGDRLKHRLMHKFVYFLDRYGLKMCVGCGRCIDAEAGGVDLRVVLKKLSEELKEKQKAKVAK